MADLYSRTDMILAVQDFLKAKNLEVCPEYDPNFEPARVPVFAYLSSGEQERQVFVDIITEAEITTADYFQDRKFERRVSEGDSLPLPNASSAQFFRHFFPNAQIFWAIPSYIQKNSEFTRFRAKCNTENIGLLEVNKTGENQFQVKQVTSTPFSLFEQRLSEIKVEIGKRNFSKRELRLKKALGRWQKEDISYLVFYPEPKYLATDISIRDEKCNISRELINKMASLNTIAYKSILQNFSKNYYQQSVDDYKAALDIIEQLWNLYDINYPKLHTDFEQVLKLDPEYRDHFLHAFQVFLYGTYIIDNLYSDVSAGFGTEIGDRVEDAWLFASTYHDYNYMIQKFDKWTHKFFTSALYLEDKDRNPASLHLSEPYVKRGYMFNTRRVAKMLGISDIDNVCLDFLYDRILEKKNHALISGLSFLKYMEKCNVTILTNRVIDAICKSISLHDKDIYLCLSGLDPRYPDDPKDEAGTNIKKKEFIKRITFVDDPIPFVLILSDSIQEEGRTDAIEYKVELEKVYFKDSRLYSDIVFKGNMSGDGYAKKSNELERISQLLQGEQRFIVAISDLTRPNRSEHKEFRI